MKNLNFFMLSMWLAIALLIPALAQADPPWDVPPAGGHIADLQNQIDNEETARIAGDATEHQHHIDGDAAEAQARQIADANLQGQISDEAAARTAADSYLQDQIDTNALSIYQKSCPGWDTCLCDNETDIAISGGIYCGPPEGWGVRYFHNQTTTGWPGWVGKCQNFYDGRDFPPENLFVICIER
jgi:hypothetical protein